MADKQMNPELSREDYLRNIRAHQNLNELDYPHKMINFCVLHEILHFQQCSKSRQSREGRILDVGCGTGYLLEKILKLGWSAQGVDPFPRGAAVQHPLKNYIIKGRIGDFDAGYYDVITAVEVIEHVQEYLALLKGMYRHLHPDGQIILTVPYNWEFRFEMSLDGNIEPMYGHLWKFSMAGLKMDLQLFFDDVVVAPIYSRTMDRRPLRFTRLLPLSWGRMISDVLVNKYKNGGWLLAVAKKKKTQPVNCAAMSKASATYYKDSMELGK